MNCLFPIAMACELPQFFPDPFGDGHPHPLAQAAADEVKAELMRTELMRTANGEEEGKMFGVLVVRCDDGRIGYLKAFSGMLAGRWSVDGFVPPAFDVLAREAFESEGALQVARLQRQVKTLHEDPRWHAVKQALEELTAQHRQAAAALACRHQQKRRERRAKREALQRLEPRRQEHLHALAQESRADKAEQKRSDLAYQASVEHLQMQEKRFSRRHRASLRLLHMICRDLMRRIHHCYVVHNARGEKQSLRALFAPAAPPSGTGDCAGPKLLAYAYAHHLQPLALMEFWWGPAPATGGRVSGVSYPACKGKCGRLLPFMLRGLRVDPAPSQRQPSLGGALEIVYEDAFVVVVNKPPGLLSIPGRGASQHHSVLTQLRFWLPQTQPVLLVHRLDQDTSGLLLAAKSQASYVILQRQFTRRTVYKRYVALVDGLVAANAGVIDLPMRLDVDERPRQVVDHQAGKAARTRWEVVQRDERETRLHLFPLTGRTHQLRVHCAHPQGLHAPIVGDRLYGKAGTRLFLHAEELGFDHPFWGKSMLFRSLAPF